MTNKIIYSGVLDSSSISKMKIPVRRAIRAAIFDNFRYELNDQECISLLPQFCNQESLVSICTKLRLVHCIVSVLYPGDPNFHFGSTNCSVYFTRKILAKTFLKF